MVRVRVPKSAEKMLSLRLKDPSSAQAKASADPFFPTNAHMVMFAASVGFDAYKFDKSPEFFKNNPDPIEMGVFQNKGLYQAIQCLSIAKEKSHEVANDDDRMAGILEGYASAGFEIINKWYEDSGSHTLLFTLELANKILERTAHKN